MYWISKDSIWNIQTGSIMLESSLLEDRFNAMNCRRGIMQVQPGA